MSRAAAVDDGRVGEAFPWPSVVAIAGLMLAAAIAAHVQRPMSRESGALIITSRPGGATIYLDGVKRTALTPATLSPVSPGRHEVQLARAGRVPWTCVVSVSPGKATHMEAVLLPEPAPAASFGGPEAAR